MAWLAQVLVELKDTPHVDLVILLVFGVDGIEFTRCATGAEEGGVEEPRETLEGSGEGGSCDVEVVVGVGGGCVRV